MNALRWAFRALVTGLALQIGAVALSGTLCMVHLMGGLAVSTLVVFLGGGAWAGGRIGPVAGFGATLLLGVGGVLFGGIEGRKAFVVTSGTLVPYASVTTWSAGDGAWLLATPRLTYLISASSTVTVRSESSYSNVAVARHTTTKATAIPLVEASTGRVVAFDCLDPEDPDEYRGDGGGYLLSLDAWKLLHEDDCGYAAEIASENATGEGHEIAPGAKTRWVRAFPSEASLREEHDLRSGYTMPLKMFGLYAVCVLLFCRVGAKDAPK